MKNEKWAVVTGADGGMGREITSALSSAGYHVIMACYNPEKAQKVRSDICKLTGNTNLEVMGLDLASMNSVVEFADQIKDRGIPINLLMNNAGTLETGLRITEDGFERTVSVNYLGPYLLTRELIPTMPNGARVVNMVSCTYAIGKLRFPKLFYGGTKQGFWRIPVYSNTKLALLLFTIKLAGLLKDKGISVNAADPGIVSTDMITMHMWFDPLTDIFFRPFILTPKQGAATAVFLLLNNEPQGITGGVFAGCKQRKLASKYTHHKQMDILWKTTEEKLRKWLSSSV